MMLIPPDSGIQKLDHCKSILSLFKILDSISLLWLLFTASMLKNVKQGGQAFLKKHRVAGHLDAIHACAVGFPEYQRYVYMPKGRKLGAEDGHRLMMNMICSRIELAKRTTQQFGQILHYESAHKFQNEGGTPVPATTEILSNGQRLVPDITTAIRMSDGRHTILCFEADNGTEPIIAYKNSRDRTELVPSSLGHKLSRYSVLRDDSRDIDNLAALQVLFVFRSSLRLANFRRRILTYYKKEMPFVWMTNLHQIEDPRQFWTGNVWTRLIHDPKPFALSKGNELSFDPISS